MGKTRSGEELEWARIRVLESSLILRLKRQGNLALHICGTGWSISGVIIQLLASTSSMRSTSRSEKIARLSAALSNVSPRFPSALRCAMCIYADIRCGGSLSACTSVASCEIGRVCFGSTCRQGCRTNRMLVVMLPHWHGWTCRHMSTIMIVTQACQA